MKAEQTRVSEHYKLRNRGLLQSFLVIFLGVIFKIAYHVWNLKEKQAKCDTVQLALGHNA